MSGGVRALDLAGAVALLQDLTARGRGERGHADVVVPGGRGPGRLFTALRRAGLPAPWWRVHLADERCVADPARRNAPAVTERLGVPVLGPPSGVTCPEAAAAWSAALAATGRFDAVVLGLGADGHVASIFPGSGEGVASDAPDAVAVTAPDPGAPRRVTLSAARLARTRVVLVVVDGPGKDAAVAALRSGADGDSPLRALGSAPRYLVDLRRP